MKVRLHYFSRTGHKYGDVISTTPRSLSTSPAGEDSYQLGFRVRLRVVTLRWIRTHDVCECTDQYATQTPKTRR